MKKLLFLILSLTILEASASVTTLTAISDVPGEVGTIVFTFNEKGVVQDRKTNTISQTDQLWFGKTKSQQNSTVKQIRKSIEEISEKLKLVDNFIKSENGENRNAFLAGSSHGLRFYVNGHIVLPGTSAFQDVSPLFEKLSSLDWSLEDGVTVDKTSLIVKKFIHGKASSESREMNCKTQDKIRICRTQDFGPIVLE